MGWIWPRRLFGTQYHCLGWPPAIREPPERGIRLADGATYSADKKKALIETVVMVVSWVLTIMVNHLSSGETSLAEGCNVQVFFDRLCS